MTERAEVELANRNGRLHPSQRGKLLDFNFWTAAVLVVAGLVLAAIAVGSAASGLVYGAIGWQTSVLRRFRLQSVAFALLPILLLAATDVPVLAMCAFVFGLGVAPALITMFGLVQQMVPARALTEGLSWIGTGLSVGYGAGAALVGGIADAHGARAAFLVVIGSALPVGVVGLLLHVRRSAEAIAPDSPTPVAP